MTSLATTTNGRNQHSHCANIDERTGAGRTTVDGVQPHDHRVGKNAQGNVVAIAMTTAGQPLDHDHVVVNQACSRPAPKPCNCGKK